MWDTMKTEVLLTLLFVAVSSAALDEVTSKVDAGICPRDYFRKHPEAYKQKQEFVKKYGLPDYSKLASCSANGTCEGNLKCCKSRCGMRCMKPLYEKDGIETLEQMYKEIAQGPVDDAYEMTEDDKNLGMCPEHFLKTHPELGGHFGKNSKNKTSHLDEQCKHGEECPHKPHEKHPKHRNFTKMADCSVDGDCDTGMRCCKTPCGKKCVKSVFTKEDYKNFLFEDKEKPRNNQDLESQSEGNGEEHANCQGKGGKHGKCKGNGGKHGKGQGKEEVTFKDDAGICPRDYFKKHPEAYKQKQEFMKKYGLPDYSKLASCSANGTCEGNLKCCKSSCGMRCMKPLYEKAGIETLEQMYKEIAQGPVDDAYEMTEDDKNLGMCPEHFLKTHPELGGHFEKHFKNKTSHSDEQCKHGEECPHKPHGKHPKHRNFTKMADCSVDGDCDTGMRCCKTPCGKKCVKSVFTKEDYKNFLFEDKEKPRNNQDLESQSEGNGEEHANCQGKGGKHGKCKGNGGKDGKGQGKEGNGKGKEQGKGKGQGKGQGKGGEHQENGQGFGSQFSGGAE